jgi:hypothetical protein
MTRSASNVKRNLVDALTALVERAFFDNCRVLILVNGSVADHEP